MLEAFDDIDQDWLLNTNQLDLQGKYVLVDFWTYSCVNCVRTVPQIEEMYRKLSSKGLVVVGVHTPEFEFEKIPPNVTRAIKNLQITYPVILDPEYYIWAYFNNQYWPAHYLFDKDGELIYESIGEEGADELVRILNEIFGEELPVSTVNSIKTGKVTPEIYLGKARGDLGNSAVCNGDSCNIYLLPDKRKAETAYLEGAWEQKEQFIESLSDESRIHIVFIGASISGVFDSPSEIFIKCSLDGEETSVKIGGPNTYNLCQTEYSQRNLVLTIPKGVRVFTLSF